MSLVPVFTLLLLTKMDALFKLSIKGLFATKEPEILTCDLLLGSALILKLGSTNILLFCEIRLLVLME